MLNLKTNRKQNHFRMLICWRWMITQGNQELQSNRKQNHFRMIICWWWVMNQSEQERQCLNKGTRHFRKRFIFLHEKLCLLWQREATHVKRCAVPIECLRYPMNKRMLSRKVIMSILPFVTLHINRKPFSLSLFHLHKFLTHKNSLNLFIEFIILLFIFFIFFI